MSWRDLPALSINQPWAWLIVAGFKDIENRNWTTEFRGEFLIHAGLKADKDCAADVWTGSHPVTGADADFAAPATFDRGGIVGIAELVGVVTKRTGGEGRPWFVGRFGFLLANARPLPFTPCRGALGFFRPDYSSTYAPRPEPKRRPAPPTVLVAPPPPAQRVFFDD